MSQLRALRIGICTENFNEKTIRYLLKSLDLPYTSYIVSNIEYERTGLFDTLLFTNPSLNEQQIKAFEKYVRNGTSAIILVSGDRFMHAGTIPLLDLLGVKIDKTQATKKLKIKYADAYPIVSKRGMTDILTSKEKKTHVLFSLMKNEGPKQKAPLITAPTLFSEQFFAVKVNYERGIIVVMNSFSFADDRAEIVGHLLTFASKNKLDFFPAVTEKIREALPEIVAQAFVAYEQVPLGIIARRAGVDRLILEEFDFMLAIEELIQEGKILAKIHGDSLIRI